MSVHVIDARELRDMSNPLQTRLPANARIRLSMEGNHSNTQEVPGDNPVWNEVIAFDILQGD